MAQKSDTELKTKWWQNGYAWLAFGGPAIVVVASLITVYIAVVGQDEVLSHEENQGEPMFKKALTQEQKNALEPAVKARNHAATGVNQE